MQEDIEHMRQLCKTRPLRYSDLDYLKKGSTAFLHEEGYSNVRIAEALDLDERDVENNLKGTGFAFDYKKIAPFEDRVPSNIGDTVVIRVPSWGNETQDHRTKATVLQCVPRGNSCGLSVSLLEDANFEIPLYGKARKGSEIVVPVDWVSK
ncbi:hypothetical protein RE474_03345 [Methanolobus sediminis]|uniref:Uncharacterized protein n=1 Tax=Methanolobus sediminis TaxID=3072978 RepID=A0AA51YMC3_9EURY|nr:hypothetical protein [Methanolobus sediminis]WMW25767.1 hypothetical protein RE474_03345 [Methanolobus sediminis]